MRPRLLLLLIPLLSGGCLIPDAMVDRILDADRDGERNAIVGGTDCDDHDGGIRAKGTEVCGNGVDDDCDEVIDDVGFGAIDFHPDADGDGFGDPALVVPACDEAAGRTLDARDCDDANREIHPGGVEVCGNQRDEDCDREVDETDRTQWWPDGDGDGWGTDAAAPVLSCAPVAGRASVPGDCDDRDAQAFPTALDVPYDGLDRGCNGDEFEFDVDHDGVPVDPAHAEPAVTDPTYAPGPVVDCDDRDAAVRPGGPETWYDGVDGDCDGGDDFDQDGDGHPSDDFGGDDCEDGDALHHPGAVDVCDDGVDADCDLTDEYDCDGDGHYARAHGGNDCDDGDADVWALCATCADRDGDGRHSGCDAYTVRPGPDCNDTDVDVWVSCATCRDADQDGRFAGCDAYVLFQWDCDDARVETWATCETCGDQDGDGRIAGCDLGNADCDDAVGNAWGACATCVDRDGDGTGVGACDGPVDCDDADPDVDVSCGRCVDLDGDGARAGCDHHLLTPFDCDDTDPAVGGQVWEIPGDGIDQDCDGRDLATDEVSGVFVAPTGLDRSGCGSRAAPCASPAYAAPVARRADKVLFLAEGTYDEFDTWVSVYGGFRASTWTGGGTTRIRLRPDGSLRVRGAATELVDLTVTSSPGVDRATAVWIDAGFVRLLRVAVEVQAASVCNGVVGTATDVAILASSVRGCGGRATNVGLGFGGDRARRMRVEASTVELLSAPAPGASTAIDLAGSFRLVDLLDVEASLGGGVDTVALLGRVPDAEVTLDGCRFLVGRFGMTPGAWAVWGQAKTLDVRRTFIDVGAADSRAIFLNGDSPTVAARFVGSAIRTEGVSNSVPVELPPTASATFVNTTLVALGGGAKTLVTDAPTTIVNSILVSDGVLVGGASPSLYLAHDLLDATCLGAPIGDGSCATPVTPRAVATCAAAGCSIGGGVTWAKDVLDPASTWGLVPFAGVGAEDAGTDPSAYDPRLEDVFGVARDPASCDLGAVEFH